MKNAIFLIFIISLISSAYSQSTDIKLDSFILYDYKDYLDTITPEAKTTYLYNWKHQLTKESYYKEQFGFLQKMSIIQHYYSKNIDSTISYYWYSNKWHQFEKLSFIHNKESLLKRKKTFIWNDTIHQWDSNATYLYSYDNSKHLILQEFYGYDYYHTYWYKYKELHWNYNKNDNLVEYAIKSWAPNSSSLEWTSIDKYEYQDDKIIREDIYRWDTKPNKLVLINIEIFNYNLFDSLTDRTIYKVEYKDTSNDRKYIKMYDSYHYPNKQYVYDWYSNINTWELYYEISFKFDNKKGLLLEKEKIGATGFGYYKKVYKYTNENKIQTVLEHDWDRDNEKWINYKRTEYSYNKDGKLILEERFQWNDVYKYWSIRYRCEYYYSVFSGITDNTKQKNITIYPNPVADRIIIDYDKIQEVNQITVSNIQGQVIKMFPKINSNFIDVSELKSGMYILNLYKATEIISLKFLKK